MGAIIRLRKMPDRCSDCPFANDEVSFCRLRNSSIIAGKKRNCRMPTCPLMNEGEYLSRQAKAIKQLMPTKGLAEFDGGAKSE